MYFKILLLCAGNFGNSDLRDPCICFMYKEGQVIMTWQERGRKWRPILKDADTALDSLPGERKEYHSFQVNITTTALFLREQQQNS